MSREFNVGLSFDDVLIRPEYTDIESRNDVDTSVMIAGIELKIPLISSPMDTVTEPKMAIAIGRLGGMGILHRFATDHERLAMIYEVMQAEVPTVFAVGASRHEMDFMQKVEDNLTYKNIDAVCIDLANGWSITMKKMVEHIKANYPGLKIIAGNVANEGGYRFLAELGVHAVRVGIGGGCFTESTKVLMADGSYKNINKIIPGEYVINRNGEPVRVNRVINNGFKNVVKLRSSSWSGDVFVTPNHRYWSADFSDVKGLNKLGRAKLIEKAKKNKESRVKWTEISQIKKGSVMLLPRNINFNLPDSFEESLFQYTKNRSHLGEIRISSNYNVGYAFGLMMGDGHTFLKANGKSQIDRINCYLGTQEESTAIKFQKILKKEFGFNSKLERAGDMINVFCYSKPLAHLFDQFGKKDERHLPRKYWVNNKEYLQGILDGLIDSDGQVESNGRISFYNTSEKLKELFEFLCLSLDKPFSSTLRAPRIGGLKDCNIENCKPYYQIRIDTSNRKSQNYIYTEILDLEEAKVQQETWDIEVDCPTHSFIANNSIVHNSICMTRIQTGIGIPTLQSVLDCNQEYHLRCQSGLHAPSIIADGGIKYPQDLCKSMIGGAGAVICGGIFAGTKEAPGEVIKITDKDLRKKYRGMASAEVQEEKRGGLKEGTVAEGVSTLIPYEGSLQRVVTEFVGGLKSSMTYVNSRVTDSYIGTPHRLIKISENGVKESHAYGTRRR